MEDERKVNEGIKYRSQDHACKKCEACDQKCDEHFSMVDFKTRTDTEISSIFDKIEGKDGLSNQVQSLQTTAKLAGVAFTIFVGFLIYLSISSYMRLNVFMLEDAKARSTDLAYFEKFKTSIEFFDKDLTELEKKLYSFDIRLHEVEK